MPNYQVQQSLVTTSSLPADYVQNNWSITADDIAALEVAVASIHDFYDAIRTNFSNNVTVGPHPWKAYDRADPVPRAPVASGTFTFASAPTGAPLPHECCIVLSFQGTVTSGIPQSRQRGRVYLGPISTSVMDADARVLDTVRTDICDAADDLYTASDAASAWTWVVWSTVLDDATTVRNGWVDNAFDTQRRRGRNTSARTLWP